MAARDRRPVSGRAVIAVVAALVAIGAGGAAEFARLLPGLEQDSVNQRFERRGAMSAPGLLVVAIDDKTFDDLGRALAVPALAATRRPSTACAATAPRPSSTTSSSPSRPRRARTTR